MKRRELLRSVPLGILAAGLAPRAMRAENFLGSPMMQALLNANQESDRVVVFIFLEGGNDGLNTLVPFEDPNYDKHRSTLGFVSPEEKASLTFRPRPDLGFNPMMNPLEPLWQEGKLAIVQNIGFDNPNLSHFRASDIWNSASNTKIVEYTGWVGRYLEHLHSDYPHTLPRDPLAITMGNYQTLLFAGQKGYVDVTVPDPQTFARAGDIVGSTFPNTEGGKELAFVRNLHGISNEYSVRFNELFPKHAMSKVAYPEDNPLATHLQHIAWCIASGMKTRFYFAPQFGYDTHFAQFSKDSAAYPYGHARKLKELAEAIVSFQADLEALGIADRVITMTYSEFGRRIAQNGPDASGTEHGTAAPHLLIGTHINGELYGHHPDLENLDGNRDAHYEFDFRQLYASVLGDWFGVDEQLRTAILSPQVSHAPFETDFPVNGSTLRRHLIDSRAAVRHASASFSQVALSPNPARDKATLTLHTDTLDTVQVRLYDIGGRRVRDLATQSVYPGKNTLALHFPQQQAGSYYVQVSDSKRTASVKLVVMS